jgi:hypothetical protein
MLVLAAPDRTTNYLGALGDSLSMLHVIAVMFMAVFEREFGNA